MDMNMNIAFASLIGAALLGSAAIAQTTGGSGQPAATNQQEQTQPGAPAGDSFVTKQSINEWRAPKLVGVGVFGPDDKQVGKIKDVLIDHDGKAQVVVIGVGGFLGMGTKDVGVPFTALRWQTEARVVPSTEPPPPPSTIGSTTSGPSAQPPAKRTDPAATEANQGYPDKAVLNMTLAQLKSAPDFKYAPDPLADLDQQSSATGGAPQRSSMP
jgi:PRC-barrel domain